MAYRLRLKEQVDDAARRIAREQADRALAAARGGGDPDAAVHAVRVRCKKVRGLLRLLRGAVAPRREENAWWRDTARLLAGSRDAAVRLAAFEKLVESPALDPAGVEAVRQTLRRDRDTAHGPADDARAALDAAADRLTAAPGRVEAWTLAASNFDALAPGLTHVYRQCRQRMRAARRDRSPRNLHRWRQRVKDHGYHCRLLRNVWPAAMTARRDEAARLGDLLGDDRDLALLAVHLRQAIGGAVAHDLLDLIDRRRAALQREALALGDRLFAEKPAAFTRRVKCYWTAWRR